MMLKLVYFFFFKQCSQVFWLINPKEPFWGTRLLQSCDWTVDSISFRIGQHKWIFKFNRLDSSTNPKRKDFALTAVLSQSMCPPTGQD